MKSDSLDVLFIEGVDAIAILKCESASCSLLAFIQVCMARIEGMRARININSNLLVKLTNKRI